jgi:hypothetical protein
MIADRTHRAVSFLSARVKSRSRFAALTGHKAMRVRRATPPRRVVRHVVHELDIRQQKVIRIAVAESFFI